MARPTPPVLKRDTGAARQPKVALTIFTEGKNTEPYYFRQLAKEYGNKVVLDIHSAVGVPLTLARRAVAEKKRRRGRRNSFEDRDQYWIVFDSDEHPNIPDACKLATDHAIAIAFSNPCFELWGILHLVEHDFNRPLHRNEAQHLLKELMPRYDPGGTKIFDYDQLAGMCDRACEKAERMKKARDEEGSPEGNPFTSVDGLARAIQGEPVSKEVAISIA